MKATRLRPAANTQLEVKEMMRLEAQAELKVAHTSFQVVTNLATDKILRTAYYKENIK